MFAQKPLVSPSSVTGWRSPVVMLMLMAAAMHISFAVWGALLNNFTIERGEFTGAEIGMLQSIREIPGFLSFPLHRESSSRRRQSAGSISCSRSF